MTSSVDPDQTTPTVAVLSGLTLFASILFVNKVCKICNRRLWQTTFSDDVFAGALRVQSQSRQKSTYFVIYLYMLGKGGGLCSRLA